MPDPTDPDPLSGYERVRDALARSTWRVHFMGIGGVGMAGLALVMKERGWVVDGCDAYDGALLEWLRGHGIRCEVGHDPAHVLTPPDFIVRSPAVRRTEPELAWAQAHDIPVIDRGRLLPAVLDRYRLVAVAGTHGKTTTASMIACILRDSGVRTSWVIGGVCPGLGAVAQAEKDGVVVVEADESDGTLQFYRPEVAVITTMDLDHVDYFRSEEQLAGVYDAFARSAHTRVYPSSDPAARRLLRGCDGAVSVSIGPGGSRSAEIAHADARGTEFILRDERGRQENFRLPVSGRHNVMNALCAVAAAEALGVSWSQSARALARFQLPRRRFELLAEAGGIRVVSDYAHHPVEISALLEQAALLGAKRVVGVFQPHRYSRTKAFFQDFARVLAGLDVLILVPVYSAFETPIEGGDTADIHRALQAAGRTDSQLAGSVEDAWMKLRAVWREGDLVLIIGAGDVDKVGACAARCLLTEKGTES